MRARRWGPPVLVAVAGVALVAGLVVLSGREPTGGPAPLTTAAHPPSIATPSPAKLVSIELLRVPTPDELAPTVLELPSQPEEPAPRPLRFVVISDLHILQAPNPERDPDSWLPPDLAELTAAIPGLEPELVVVTGDLTSGDHRLRHRERTVDRWWEAVSEALEPIRAAGIPILPIPGNHDLYQPEHRDGYRRWANLDYWMGRLAGARVDDPDNPDDAPLYYAVDYEYVHLVLLAVPGRHLDETQLRWLRRDLAATPAESVRLAFGHIPLRSAIGGELTNSRLLRDLGTPLVEGGVSAYFAGHEHVLWDEVLEVAGRPLRQVIAGVGGGGYRYTLHGRYVREHCDHEECVLPTGEFRFAALNGRMRDVASCVLAEVAPDGTLSVQPYVLREGRLVPLEPAGETRLAVRRRD